jgi:hypothetical protein
MEALNSWLDRLPRDHVWCSGRPVPTYRAMGVVGYHLAVGVIVLDALAQGRPVSVALGVALVCGLSFFVWALLRLWVTGAENIVLLEHVWVACGATVGFLIAVRQPVGPWLDVVAVALCPFLACGRVGCLLTGCCHGFPAGIGIVYRRPTHPLCGARLFPLPLIEFVGLVLLGAIGQAGLGSYRPGTVALMLAAGYAVLRFATEGLRGDRTLRRGPLSSGRVMALTQLAGVVAIDEWLRQALPRTERLGLLAAGVVLVAVLGWRWRRARPLSREVIRGLRRMAVDPPRPGTTVLGDGVVVAATPHPVGTLLTVAVDAAPPGVAARLCVAAFGREPDAVGADGVAHIMVDSDRLPVPEPR